MSDLPNVLPDVPSTAQNSPMRAVSLSDYNRVLESQGKEPISLGDNEFAINCNSYLVEPYYHMEIINPSLSTVKNISWESINYYKKLCLQIIH